MMAAYYNEFDPGAAAWLRELIKAGLIADGDVDERSILDVRPSELSGFTQCHFFAGIGGWSYALRLAGWPDDRPVWTGSPPCQPFSAAGQMLGRDDPRHLAPHFIDLVRACRPSVLFGEQVASSDVFGKAAKRARGNAVAPPQWAWIDDLSDRLEAARYAIGASDFPSAGVGAPHIRQRTFFGAIDLERMADSDGPGPLSGSQPGIHRGKEGAGPWNGEPERSGSAGGMADSPSHRRDGRQDPAGSRGWLGAEASGDAGWLGNPDGSRGAARLSEPAQRHEGIAEVPNHGGGGLSGPDAGRSAACGLADGASSGRGEERPYDRGCAFGDSAEGIAAGSGAGDGDSGADAPHSFWSDPDWLFCRDGKWRPVEPTVFGISDGVPAELVHSGAFVPASYPLAKACKESRRVMRLRGYGNAINPWAAKVFIESFRDVIDAPAQ